MRKKIFKIISGVAFAFLLLLPTITSAGSFEYFSFNMPKWGYHSNGVGYQTKTTTRPAQVKNIVVAYGYGCNFSVWRYNAHKKKEVRKTEEQFKYTGQNADLSYYDPYYEKGERGFRLYGRGKASNYVVVTVKGSWNAN